MFDSFLKLAMSVTMAMVASALVLAQTPRSGDHFVGGIHYHGQVTTEDCETAALQMALDHEKIHVSQNTLLGAERVSLQGPVTDADGKVLRWGNPNTQFVGEPNSASISTRYTAHSGYGTYAPNIARLAREFGGQVVWEGTGLSIAQLKSELEAQHPVIAWVGDRAGHMRFSALATWQAWDGTTVVYPDPASGVYEHAVLIAGWNNRGVWVDDPLNGARKGSNINPRVGPGWVSWKEFLAGFKTFHNMAVILK